jgi:Na+/proline symporter
VLPFKLVPENMLTPGAHSYNDVLPLMLARYCGPGLLGLGVTALIAGFMSGMAGNVSAFATVWTYDIYRAMIRKNATDSHYVAMGRWCTVIGVAVSVGHILSGETLAQHHGLRAGAFQFLHCALVRHRASGHDVEAESGGVVECCYSV